MLMSANICAPGRYDKENNTCFSLEQLIEMASAYNRFITINKLSPIKKLSGIDNQELIEIKKDKKYLLNEFKKRFSKCGNDDFCLTKQKFMNEIVKEMRDDIQNNTFRPMGPTQPTQWLSTIDINRIMSQYEEVYPDFKFLGAVPSDCAKFSFCSLHNVNFDQYNTNNISKLGVIFNLDKYGEPGSHWVSLYIDIVKGEIYYCDSTGKPPLEDMKLFIDHFINYYLQKTGKEAIYKYNNIPYQKDNSECGIYSCNFLIRKLNGETFENIIKNSLTFEQINSCRNVYFRNKISNAKLHFQCDPKFNSN